MVYFWRFLSIIWVAFVVVPLFIVAQYLQAVWELCCGFTYENFYEIPMPQEKLDSMNIPHEYHGFARVYLKIIAPFIASTINIIYAIKNIKY